MNDRTTTPHPRPHAPGCLRRAAALSILIACALLASACGSTTADAETPVYRPPNKVTASRTPPALVMPSLTGMEPADAWGALTDAGIDWLDDMETFHDLSVLHREVPAWDWQVFTTVPEAGTPLEPGDRVVAFALNQAEYAFFTKHERMPRTGFKRGKPMPSYYGDMFKGMDLFEDRWAPHRTPRDAERTTTWPKPTAGLPRQLDPSVEPRRERRLRAALREVGTQPGIFVTSIPRPGKPLRPGQMITFVLRPHPDAEPEVYGIKPKDSGNTWFHYSNGDDDGDDDWNVPGWLCPTRFC